MPSIDKDKWKHSDSDVPIVENKSHDVSKAALPHVADAGGNGAKTGAAGFAVGLLLPLVVVMSLVFWVFYAYRNPHTKSGQLLIQVRVLRSIHT